MKVRSTEFDGTSEEFIKVGHLFGISSLTNDTKLATDRQERVHSTDEGAEITPELVTLVLTRLYLSSNVRKVFKAMLRSGPRGLSTAEIAEAVGITPAQLSGVFGAFGRRVANTEGWPPEKSFVAFARDDENEGEWRYWLPQVVRDVLESGRIKL